MALGATPTGCSSPDTASTGTTTTVPGTVPGTTTTEAPLEAGKQIFVYTPEVGDCFDRREITSQAGGRTDVVLVLDCGLPHQFEVFAVLEYPVDPVALADPNTKTWPGDEAVRKWAKEECPRRVRDYVGVEYELSRFEVTFDVPTEKTWLSDRTVTCLLEEPGEGRRMSGSARDSRQ